MTELRFTGSRGDGPDSVSVTRDPAAGYNNGGPLSVAAALEGLAHLNVITWWFVSGRRLGFGPINS